MAKESTKLTKEERAARRQAAALVDREHTPSKTGLILKWTFLLIFNTAAFFVGNIMAMQQEWVFVAALVVVVIAMNWIYIGRRLLPAKYLAPGVLFLICFSLSVVVFSFFIAFTNYSGYHNGSKQDAIHSIKLGTMVTDTNAPWMDVTVVQDSAHKDYWLATDANSDVQADGSVKTHIYFGGEDFNASPWHEVTGAELSKVTMAPGMMGYDIASSYQGYTALSANQVAKDALTLSTLKVPLGANLDQAGWMALDPSGAGVQRTYYDAIYDAAKDTFTQASTGTVYKANEKDGFYEAADGTRLSDTGWQVVVGFKNFQEIFGNDKLRGPLMGVITWTIIFAVVSVLSTFILGLALALLFNDDRIRGKKIYRSIMILPYAFPGFLSAYVWKGLFNQQYGFINSGILHCKMAANNCIPWLSDPTAAKYAVLLCNLWLGFPYMFLISTGALQAIPSELVESATIDGATAWQQFRLIKLPLLLVSLAPLLISSFAFNFNNFTIIYLVTGGGPAGDPSLGVQVGGTDILISFVYKIAFSTGQGANYGLASAFSVLIFFVVGGLSMIGFRRTRFLEEVTE